MANYAAAHADYPTAEVFCGNGQLEESWCFPTQKGSARGRRRWCHMQDDYGYDQSEDGYPDDDWNRR